MKLTTLLLLSSCPYLVSCHSLETTRIIQETETLAANQTDKWYCDTSIFAAAYVPATRSSTFIGGQTRYWFTYTPQPSPGPVPLVLDLHGYSGCAAGNPIYTGWKELAAEEGFYAVWPQGTNNWFFQPVPCWNAGSCCCIYDNDIPDSNFLKRIIDETIEDAQGKIDPTRVYIAGHSNGCFMSQRFVADFPGVVAGVACHAGVMGTNHPDPDDPDWIPTAIVNVHGDRDYIIPYGPNFYYFGAEENNDLWGESNGCTKKDIVPQGNDIITHTWTGCDRGVATQLIQVLGGDHSPYASYGYVDTTAIAWNYVKNFSLDPDCSRGKFYVMIEIFTDNNPEDTSIKMALGTPDNVVLTRDDFNEPNFKYTIDSCVPIDKCYIFTIYDSSGDGLSGDSGYQIFGNGNLIAEGSFDNGFEEEINFNC